MCDVMTKFNPFSEFMYWPPDGSTSRCSMASDALVGVFSAGHPVIGAPSAGRWTVQGDSCLLNVPMKYSTDHTLTLSFSHYRHQNMLEGQA